MAEPRRDEPRIILHPPQDVQAYWAYEHQLEQIEQAHSQLSRHGAFASTSLTVCVTIAVALLTCNPSTGALIVLACLAAVSGVLGLYALWEWWHEKGTIPTVIAKIRTREMQPEAPPLEQQPESPGPGSPLK